MNGAGVVTVPFVEVPSPQVMAYVHGPSFDPASLNATVRGTVSPGLAVRSGPAFTAGIGM